MDNLVKQKWAVIYRFLRKHDELLRLCVHLVEKGVLLYVALHNL